MNRHFFSTTTLGLAAGRGADHHIDGAYGDASDENDVKTLDVIAYPKFILIGELINAPKVTSELVSDTLRETGEVKANVAADLAISDLDRMSGQAGSVAKIEKRSRDGATGETA